MSLHPAAVDEEKLTGMAIEFTGHMVNIEKDARAIVASPGNLICLTYHNLINSADAALDGLDTLLKASAGRQSRYIEALKSAYKTTYGIEYTKAELSDILTAMETALRTFVLAAIDDEPKDAIDGTLKLHTRNVTTRSAENFSIAPAPASTLTIVQALVDAFEVPTE